ncbi:peptidoglycan-binding protein [Streptomyces triticiradicis]|uniref:Peptidoglycan-binding protein n=1 Tax=Streptomyces triticiradicis TaxID=2651189 RepID=A0A7J5DBE4_9ACTN|nr:peptidoglycan-binding protein [Streptomyces triticiradicis]KAB1984180.1 peptidoglycan-binding protein [Streptomyces triticiradicis]
MPLEQHINLTVLPAGLSDDGTQARVSVFFAPRLQPEHEGGTLSGFGDFVSWPDKLKDATFEFATEEDGTGAPPVAHGPFAGPLSPQGPPPDAGLWRKLFHENTPLEPYAFESSSEREQRTYSAAQVSGYTKRVYVGAAMGSPEAPPSTRRALNLQSSAPVDEPEGPPQPGIPHTDETPLRTLGTQDGAVVPPDLAALNAFHSVPQPSTTVGEGLAADLQPPPPDPPQPPSLPPADFHTMLTSLGDHPVLLRRLGLVLDFLLPAEQLPASSGERLLTVVPHWTSALEQGAFDVSCRTRYVFSADPLDPACRVFVPAAQSPAHGDPLASPTRGLVVLSGNFALEQADIDGAAFKLLSVPEDATGLSPVRTRGFSLIRHERAGSLKTEFQRAADHESAFSQVVSAQRADNGVPAGETPGAAPGAPQNAGASPQHAQDGTSAPELLAQDLVRGHRLDVWDETRGAWFSLHERAVEYRQPGAGPVLLTAPDEGFFQAHLASPPHEAVPPATAPPLYVPEQLVSWHGWSLSAPRPGLVLDTDPGSPDDHLPPNKPVPPRNDAPPGVPLEITVKVRPGSLPRLRFGHRYRVRLRTVDLAGNGLDVTQATALKALPGTALPDPGTQPFQRFEAVPAPVVVPRLPFGEGASAVRMVIRSSPGAEPPPAGPPGPDGQTAAVALADVRFGLTNDAVRTVQKALIAAGHPLLGGADGVFGDQTRKAYAAEQRAQGFSGADADGDPGCQSLTELGHKSGFTVDCGNGFAPADGSTAEQFAADFNESALVSSQGHVAYQGVDERHLVAPKASLQCVEWHGLLDTAIGSTDPGAQDTVYALATRENGSLGDAQTGVQLKPADSPAADPGPPASIALHTGEQIELPYLPDPLSMGAVLLDLPGMPAGQPFTVPWEGDVWHRPRSLRVRLAEGTAPPRFDDASRVLTVSLPKGAVATVRVCSGIDFDADLMGMASWCRQAPDLTPAPATGTDDAAVTTAESPHPEAVLELAAASRHWMFTPWHELTLVHAVQRPLRTPVLDLSPSAAPRAPGATAEHLAGTIALDEASTGRIELVAEWTEVTDAGPTGRDARPMAAPVFGILTGRADPPGTPGPQVAVLDNGVLTFSTQASEDRAKTAADAAKTADDQAKAARAAAKEAADAAKAAKDAGDLAEAAAKSKEAAGSRADGVEAAAKAAIAPVVLQNHEFGDTRHRTVCYRPVAGSRFADCFPAQFADPGESALTVTGTPQEHSVPSSAAPTAPRLLYCMPTLALERATGPSGAIVQRRLGGGIRVYVDRPWYSSGDGELLGVVLGEPPGGDPASVRDSWVTLMGRDPLHRSAPVVAPTADMFTNAVQRSGPLSVTTPSGPLPVTVVGFAPQFDADEKGGRWFFDLEMDTGDVCLPFVRLALVRFQPESIPGHEISPVVLADLVRTLPDRELTVRPGPVLSVSVTGPSWDPTDSPPPLITAVLQRRHEVVGDDDLGWVTLDDTSTPLTSIDADSSHRPFYTGQVTVPPVGPGVPLRLTVVETENIPADAPPPAALPTPPGPVLYCDTVDLFPGSGGQDDDNDDGHIPHHWPHGGGPHGGGPHGDGDHDGHQGSGGHGGFSHH